VIIYDLENKQMKINGGGPRVPKVSAIRLVKSMICQKLRKQITIYWHIFRILNCLMCSQA
jgi:hypothetical protein